MSKAPVLAILGAGANIGGGVARAFASKGYRVALVSRSENKEIQVAGSIHVKGDLSDPSSVASAFAEIRKSLGIPSVVVYNASAFTSHNKADPASFPIASLTADLAVNTFGVFNAANEAVKGFRDLPPDASKTFIFTGNILNVQPIPGFMSLGIGKSATAQFIADASSAYKTENFRFYYADERTSEGGGSYSGIDGDAHGSMYYQLAAGESSAPWLATFVKGVGYKDFSKSSS